MRQNLCTIINETPRDIPEDFLRSVAEAAMREEGVEGELTVLIVDEARMRELNKQFRGIDEATDVLSFPEAEARNNNLPQQTSANRVYLGEIAVCPTFLRIPEGKDERWEFAHVVVHGTFHLLGRHHEHSKEAHTRLHALEERIIEGASK